jgi:hypothetical protein
VSSTTSKSSFAAAASATGTAYSINGKDMCEDSDISDDENSCSEEEDDFQDEESENNISVDDEASNAKSNAKKSTKAAAKQQPARKSVGAGKAKNNNSFESQASTFSIYNNNQQSQTMVHHAATTTPPMMMRPLSPIQTNTTTQAAYTQQFPQLTGFQYSHQHHHHPYPHTSYLFDQQQYAQYAQQNGTANTYLNPSFYQSGNGFNSNSGNSQQTSPPTYQPPQFQASLNAAVAAASGFTNASSNLDYSNFVNY